MEQRQDKPTTPKRHGAKKRRARYERLFLLAAVLLLLSASSIGLYLVTAPQAAQPQVQSESNVKNDIKSLAQSTEAAQLAKGLKDDYSALLDALKAQDLPAAQSARAAAETDIRALEAYLDSPLLRAAASFPGLRGEIGTVRDYLDLARTANTALLDPLLALMEEAPFSAFKAEGGVRTDVLLRYVDLAETLLPEARALSERLDNTDLSLLQLADSEGKIPALAAKLRETLALTEDYLPYLPQLRRMLGSEGDRLYVFAAQNTSEIRASGGFPGSVGLLRIRDGVLMLEDFQSCYDVFQGATPAEAGVTPLENKLFAGRMRLAWDSDFCPDFERVATIWALSYQARNREAVDGVVSATPVIIQRLLAFLGSITLDDGTVLDGTNALRVIGHDLYYRYLATENWRSNNGYVDMLFSETAGRTLDLLIATAGAEHLGDYLSFARESFADRTLLLWMADPAEEAALKALGWAGSLNTDETRPQLGVFYNSTAASKMGWYLDIDAAIGEPTDNDDGSKTWPVVVTYTNTLDRDDQWRAGSYILGGYGGLTGGLYIFAPAGGSFQSYRASSGYLYSEEYEGLQMIYQYGTIDVGASFVIELEVTTSPLAVEPLTVMQTPTAQNYR